MTTTGALVSYDPNACYEVKWRDFEYRRLGNDVFLARIYEPQGEGPFPLAVEVHGGGWRGGLGSGRRQNELVNERMAASGIVVAAVEYRGSQAGFFPVAEADVNYAVRWFKAHAADFNASREFVGGIGSSTGGHLIMLNAMMPSEPLYAQYPLDDAPDLDASVDWVVLNFPALHPPGMYASDIRPELMRCAADHFGSVQSMMKGSPFEIVMRFSPQQTPPCVIFQGTIDMSVPPIEIERFTYFYSCAGALVELIKYPGEPHGFFREAGAATEHYLEATKSFISRQLRAARAAS